MAIPVEPCVVDLVSVALNYHAQNNNSFRGGGGGGEVEPSTGNVSDLSVAPSSPCQIMPAEKLP